jgi:hypothetical protein
MTADDLTSVNEPLDPGRTARTPVSINEPPHVTMPEKPEITGYDPYECAIGDPDFTLVVSGTGFYPQSIIHFAGHDEPTTLTEDGTLTTGVKPSLWLAPATVQLSIFNGPIESNIVEFVFNEAAAPATPPNPSLNSINPNSANEDAGSVSFNATGTRFYDGSKISFGGEFIDTLFVDAGKLTGTFDTTTYGEGNFLVYVDSQGGGQSISKTFTIKPAGSAAAEEAVDEDLADPDVMEDEIEAAEEEGDFVPTHGAKPKPKKRKR